MSNSIIYNSVYNIASKGFNVLYPMITSAYISRIFHADGVGLLMYAINIVTYFSLAASLGVPNYAVKVLSPLKNSPSKLNKCFSEIAYIIAFSSIFFSVVYYFLIEMIFSNSIQLYHAGVVLGLIIITNITNYDWLFESMEDYKYLAIRSIIVKCLLLTLMFVIVKTRDDLVNYCFIYSGISVFNNFWNLFSFHKYVSFSFHNIHLGRHIKPILILFAAAFATEIYTLLDSTMLGIMCPSACLGYYSNSSRVVRATYGVLFAIIAVFNPRLCNYYGSGKLNLYKSLFQKYYDLGILISFPAACFLFCASDYIIGLLFGPGFEPAILNLKILSVLIIVFTMATIFGHIPLIIYGKEKELLFSTIIGACVNFCLNQCLIPVLQHNGAAIASVISELLVTSIMIYFSIKIVRVSFFANHDFKVVFLATVLMFIVGCCSSLFLKFDNKFLMILLIGSLSFFSYFLVLVFMNHSLVKRLVFRKHY